MTIFTDHWKHRDFSPSRMNDTQDLHTDGFMIIIATAGEERPTKTTPPHVVDCVVVRCVLAAGDIAGMIEIAELMARLRRHRCHDNIGLRAVVIDGIAFDAQKLWRFCIAVLGTGPVGWRVAKHADRPGGALYLFSEQWRGCVMGLTKGDGPQVLP